MSKIHFVGAREILDSRGNPTVEAWVKLEDGTEATASVPSGASTGTHEAWELRDGDMRRYHGQGVLTAVQHINTEIAARIQGMDPREQSQLDIALCELDGTENKSRLGANAILGVSLAVCRAAARSAKIPLYQHIAHLTQRSLRDLALPMPMFNIVNGGKHSNSGLSVQEFKIVPLGVEHYKEQLRAGSEIFHSLASILDATGFQTSVGDEGGFAPRLKSHEMQLDMISQAIEKAGYQRGKDIYLDLDVAAQSFYDTEKNVYTLSPEGKALSADALVDLYGEWIERYDIISLEDGLHEEDWSGWAAMCEKLTRKPTKHGSEVMLVGDDLLVTNSKRLQQAIDTGACNAVLIKVNQIGTVTETLDCMRLAQEHGFRRVISHRSGETTDDFIADLAVGAGAEFIKTGSLARGERLVKYNRLLVIDEELKQQNGK